MTCTADKTVWHGLLRVAAIIAAIFWTVAAMGARAETTGVVTAARLNVRPTPGTQKPPVMILRKDAVVSVLGHHGTWVKIAYKGRSGWVKNRRKYIRIEPAPGGNTAEAPPAASQIDRAKKKARDIRQQIAAGRAQVVSFNQKEVAVVDSLNAIARALNDARKRRNAIERELAALDEKMAETKSGIRVLSEKRDAKIAHASRRLVALYKLSRIGRIHILASAASFHDLFLRETILDRILNHDRSMLNDLAENQAALSRLLASARTQKAAKSALEAELADQIENMSDKRRQRKAVLAAIRNKKSLQLAAIEALKQSAVQLDEQIRLLSLQQVQSEPTFGLPDKPFAALKGLLKMPVKGKILSRFGPYKTRQFNVINFRNGIDIQAERGDPVRAVCKGKVVFADWFKGYGNMIIIDHGNRFYTVYANIEELFKQAGQPVQTGEVVATVGDAGSAAGAKLYFEIRKDRKPVDPLKWIDRG